MLIITSPKLSEFQKKLQNLPQRHFGTKQQLFCSRISQYSVIVEFPVPANAQKLPKRISGNMLHKSTSQCKIPTVPEEGWFGQPKY